jgi:hypothetical protein
MVGLVGWVGGEMGNGSEGNGRDENKRRKEKKSTRGGQRDK